MRVIINADDFGYSSEVNSAIEKAVVAGKISSTTIMANAPFFDEAVSIAKKYKYISYGVHLNLIEFAPLTNESIFLKYHLIDETGSFIQGEIYRVKSFSAELIRAIKEEWSAQIKKVVDAGITISHIDSHQHTHNITSLQNILLEIMDDFGIKKCRRRCFFSIWRVLRSRSYIFPKYNNNGNKPNNSQEKLKKRCCIGKLINHLFIFPIKQYKWISRIKNNKIITDDIVSYQWFVQDVKKYPYLYYSKTIEIECHPGLPSNREETSLLMQDELKKIIPKYTLITYREV